MLLLLPPAATCLPLPQAPQLDHPNSNVSSNNDDNNNCPAVFAAAALAVVVDVVNDGVVVASAAAADVGVRVAVLHAPNGVVVLVWFRGLYCISKLFVFV